MLRFTSPVRGSRREMGLGGLRRESLAAAGESLAAVRNAAAWLGLVPRQHSSGGKATLMGMSKRGDAYLRTLLIHGARSVICRANQKGDPDSWLIKLITRRNANVAAVALANKTARIVWALLAHDRDFRPNYATV